MAAVDYNNRVEQLFIAYLGRPANSTELETFSAEYNTIVEWNAANAANPAAWKTFYNMNLSSYLLNNSAFKGSTNYGQVAQDMYTRLTGNDIPLDLYNVLVGRMMDGNWGVDKLAIKMLKATGMWANGDGTYSKPAAFQFQATASQPAVTTDFTLTNAADRDNAIAKVAGANLFTDQLTTAAANTALLSAPAGAVTFLAGVSAATPATQTTAAAAATGVVDAGAGATGQTFMLTTGVDSGTAFTGGAGNDTFNALIDDAGGDPDLTTLTALDSIDGGAGTDTLKISAITAVAVPPGAVVANIENVTIAAASTVGTFAADDAGALDLSTVFAGVTNLTVTSGTAADFEAGTSTAVNLSGVTGGVEIVGGASQTVSLAAQGGAVQLSGSTGAVSVTSAKHGANTIDVDGGSTVTVNTTSTVDNGAITIGATTPATGAVSVTSNLNGDGTATLDQADITITGGSTVTVNSNLTITAKDQDADSAHTFGDVRVNSDGKTTSVTVNQTYAETEFTKAAVAVVKELHTVTFKALASGETTTVDGLTFTASKALTAAEVAQAFSNLTASDTQTSGGKVANGVFTGDLSANFTSGAANGAVVVFTAKDEAETLALTAGGVDPTETVAAGTIAAAADTSVNTITYGAVRVDDAATASITTLTINGYGSADIGNTTANDLNALTTLSLANSGGTATVDTSAATLGLTVNKVAHTVDLSGAASLKTLNVTASGANSTFGLTAATVETLTVAGDKVLDIDTGSTLSALKTVAVSGSAGLSLAAGVAGTLTSVNTSDTTGTVTATIDASKATYTGGAGVDNVTLSTTTVDKAVNLGGGNDTLTLASGTTALTSEMIGGDDTDTLVMDAADAVTASATTTFETKITGFEKLSVGASTTAGTVDLDNMDGISYVISANGASVATTETSAITFKALAIGQSVTVDGLKLTADEAMTDAEVAGAFASRAASWDGTGYGGKGILSGALSANWASGVATGAAVTFTNANADSNETDIVTASAGIAAPTAVVVTDSADQTESAAVTFKALAQNEYQTVGGLTLTVTDVGGMTDTEVATAFASIAAGGAGGAVAGGKGTFTGALTGWSSAAAAGAAVTFTSATADLNVTDLVLDSDAVAPATQAKTQGYASETVTFKALDIGQSVTVDGLTLKAIAAMTAAEVAAVFASLAATGTGNVDAKGTLSGALSANWASQAAGGVGVDEVEFRSQTVGVDETGLVQSQAGVAAPTALGVSTTQGNDGTGSGTLTISNMANDGTLELTAVDGSGVTVVMKDATGTADSFNFVLDVVSADIDFGNNTVAGVETIDITADDTLLDDDADPTTIDAVETATFKLTAAAAKTVNVDGDANLALDISASTAVTAVNAANLSGVLTLTATGAAAVTVNGGSGADVLTAAGSGDTLIGGAGADKLTGADLTTLTGGDGNDIFFMNKPSNVNSYSNISDLAAGDIIDLDVTNNGTVVFTQSAVTLASTAVFQDYANAAVNALSTDADNAAWFQFDNNTYIVQSGNNTAANDFVNGSDSIIKIVGLVDLSAASYNQDDGTLQIA